MINQLNANYYLALHCSYNIYDENIDDLINQISLEDFEMKLVAKKYNIG